jgi:hypothetical protein
LAAGHITHPPFGGGVHPAPAPVQAKRTEEDEEPIVQRIVPVETTSIPEEALAALNAGLMPPAAPRPEEVPEPDPAPAPPAAPTPVIEAPLLRSPEGQTAVEFLDRVGFPPPDGKHFICRNTYLYKRGHSNGSFVMRYASSSGQRREMGLGSFIAISRERAIAAIADAIRLSEQKQALLLSGVDPLDEKQETDNQASEVPVFREQPSEPLPAPTADPRGITVADLDRWREQLRAAHPPESIKPPEHDDLRCALWSDGRLVIEAQGLKLALSAKNSRKLIQYLDRVLLDEGEAACGVA